MAILHINSSGFNFGADCWVSALKRRGLNVVFRDKFNAGERDFRTLITYDNTRALIQASEELGKKYGRKPTSDEMVAYLSTLKDFDTVYGHKIAMSERFLRCPPVLEKIENGKMVPVP